MPYVYQPMRFVLFLVIAIALWPGPAAIGQGTEGMLPDPISTRDINEYGDRLKLSDQQRAAAEAMHDQYKAEFRTLRDNEIAEFLKAMRKMNGNGMMPKREDVETFVAKMNQLNSRIASVDGRLFDQLQTVLTPEQQSRLPRVRQARQRARYSAAQFMMVSAQHIVDLSGIVGEMELAPDQFVIVDQIMSQYESKLTSNMGKLYDASTGMITGAFEAIEKSGLADADMTDPETSEKVMQVMQGVFRDLMQKSLEISSETVELNHRTVRSLVGALPEEQSWIIRMAFYREAYPEVAFAFNNAAVALQEATKSTELSDEQRQAVASALSSYKAKLERLIADSIAVIDETRGAFMPWDDNSESMEKRTAAITEASERAQELHREAQQALDALGPDMKRKFIIAAQSWMERNANIHGADVLIQSMNDDFEGELEEDEDDAEEIDEDVMAELEAPSIMFAQDPFVPGPIDDRKLMELTAALNLSDEQRSVLAELHAGYHEKYRLIQENEIKKCVERQTSMWQYDEATQTTTWPTEQKINECYELRHAATESVKALDRAFLDDVEVVLTAEQQPRMNGVRLARERGWYAGGYGGGWWGSGSNESTVDLIALVQQQKLEPKLMAQLEPILADYDQRSTPLFGERFKAAIDMQRSMELWQGKFQEAQQKGEIASANAQYRQIIGPAMKRSSQASAAIIELNTNTLQKLESALPPDATFALRNSYNAKAFPNVYMDVGSLLDRLAQARTLADLSDDQRQRISDLQAEYQPAYDEISLQMVKAFNGLESVNFLEEDSNAAVNWQERQEQISRLQFDRSELNARAASKLKGILNEDQLKRIGGLPEQDEG